jgi:hypothetical protein
MRAKFRITHIWRKRKSKTTKKSKEAMKMSPETKKKVLREKEEPHEGNEDRSKDSLVSRAVCPSGEKPRATEPAGMSDCIRAKSW